MPIIIVRDDITKMNVDAVVTAANSALSGSGGVDKSIHRAAGGELLSECKTLGGCQVGEAKITGAYKLPCKYIIHTVGPVWYGGKDGEAKKLSLCYRNSLSAARDAGCETVAFPLISAGAHGYPRDLALKVAVSTVEEFLYENEMTVYLVVFDKKSFDIGKAQYAEIREFIDDNYAERHGDGRRRRGMRSNVAGGALMAMPCESAAQKSLIWDGDIPEELTRRIGELDESFTEMLLRKIDEKGMTDVQCYKRANVDRKHFSKIRSDMGYKPKKTTAIAFAIALELSMEETEELLRKAGYALSHSNKFDVIIEFFIRGRNYNINEINEALFAFDQVLLGV